MNERFLELNKLISATFDSYLAELDVLAQRACEGKDQTGIAICGSISKSYIEKANVARETYRSQLSASGVSDMPEASDILGSLTVLESNRVALLPKIAAFTTFANENHLASDAVIGEFASVSHEIETFNNSLHQRAPDEKTLVLARVLTDLRQSWSGTAEPLVYFSMVIAFLPDMLAITFTTILLITRTASRESTTVRRAVRQTLDEAEGYEKYAAALERLRDAKRTYRWRRRDANVDRAVDESVADNV